MVKAFLTCIILYAFFVTCDCVEVSLHQGNTEILKTSGHTFLSLEAALLLSVQRISTSGKVQFLGNAQRICLVFSDLTLSMRRVTGSRESRTFGVGPSYRS